MKKLTCSIFTVLFACCFTKAQVHINNGIDTVDVKNKRVLDFYIGYINAFKGKSKLPDYKKYWSEKDCQNYKTPDPTVYGVSGEYPTYLMTESKTICYFKPLKDGFFNVKMLGAYTDSLKKTEPYYMTNQFLKIEKGGKITLVQPIEFYSKSWTKRAFGQLTYHYPKYHQFNKRKAEELIGKIKSLEREWSLSPKSIKYFFADTYDEIQQIRGFDFSIGMGNADKPMGISNPDDQTVFCAGHGENYFHEVVHIYLLPLFPKSPLNEGIAVFYGGTLGKPLSWHTNRVKDYLKAHPEINLSKPDDFYYMDNYTNPNSTIQGIICEAVYKKDGLEGLKRLMTYTSLNDVFEKEFKMDLKNLNQELRKLIDEQ